MKRFPLTIILLVFCNMAASEQSIRQLIDSARYNKQKDFAKVISFSTKAYNKAKAAKETKLEAESAFVHGMGNYLSGKYDECLRWYFESERLYTTVKDTAGLAELYSDMTIFYLRVKKFKDAVSKRQFNIRKL